MINQEIVNLLRWNEEKAVRIRALESERDEAVSARKHTWGWMTSHYGKLEDWARKQLPEPFQTEFFNCVANGVWSQTLDNAPPYICNAGFVIRPSGYFHLKTAAEQLLFNQWKRAEDAEAENAALKVDLQCAEQHLENGEQMYIAMRDRCARTEQQLQDAEEKIRGLDALIAATAQEPQPAFVLSTTL